MTDIQLVVKKARNLAAGDSNGLSDPYVVVTAGTQKKKSRTIKQTLNPVWNQPFVIDIGDIEGFVLSVYDWDALSKDDFLGEVRIPFHGLKVDGQEVWYTLQPRSKGKTKIKVSGEICVAFSEPPKRGTVAKIPSSVINDIKTRIKTALRDHSMEVDLSACSLAKTPNAVAQNLSYVHELNLSFNHFEDWPALHAFGALKKLDLSGNRLKRMGETVSALTSLEELMLNGNQLITLPNEVGDLQRLEKFDMANNRLQALPRAIGRLTRLEEMNLTGNPLATVPPSMGECASMEVLDMSCCQLEQLPEQFCYMTKLIELNLGNNQLTILPHSIGRMTRLCVLNVSDNNLKDLPISMGYCVGLGQLGAGINIDRNPIESEKILAKWQVGTDHLLQYLEARMDAMGRPEMPFPPHSRVNQDGTEQLIEVKQPSKAKSTIKPNAVQAAPAANPMAEKIIALVQWADTVIQQEFKPSLTSMKYEISQARTIEAALPYANIVRALKPHITKLREILPGLKLPPTQTLSDGDSKLHKLKVTLDTAVCDCLIVINGLQRKLLETNEQRDIVTFVPIVKAMREQLLQASH